ncbi:glutathione peroxidase [Alicyclobacillus tolerans]|uniref:Glutathione peroxidase n=1 Tax=Alicyclobacillus tolerans TaxID=90970 RepID=A0A1M6MYN9_9BACL|nr:glutathione peroxidase [Alicyclobacillus montanus]SHJ88559.1 glutathione peroxidase [Alicyclobacillus montanus]
MSIYNFSVQTLDGEEQSMEMYRGKVLLIVNTASQCGFTPQYEGLQKLYETYGDKGLVVLGFPCNQFGGQEPGNEEEIRNFCETRYHVTFPMFVKVEVNGPNAHPLFQYLKKEEKGALGTESIKWNFTKFLVGRDGQTIHRYSPNTSPESIKPDIEKALAAV